MPLRRVVVALLAAAGLAAGGVAVFSVVGPDPELPGIVREPAPVTDGLRFHDHSRGDEPREVELRPDDGTVMLAYFGYLSCPDMCPLTMSDLQRARELLGDELADRTTVAFVTVDPQRDQPSDVRRYLDIFFDDGYLALRAPDEDDLERAADQLNVRYEIEDHEPGEPYEVAHSAITYVIDDTGTVIRELPFGAEAEDYARVIEAALTDAAT